MPTVNDLGADYNVGPTLDNLGAGTQQVFGSPPGLPMQASDLPQPGPAYSGRMTWFNPRPYSYTDPSTGTNWTDYGARSLREGYHASGLPIETPGFATVGRSGLGGWHLITLPDGRQVVAQKTDIGPPGVVDINAALASRAYPGGPSTVPGGRITTQYLGSELPYGTTPGIVGGTGWQETVAPNQAGVGYVPAGKVAQGATTSPTDLIPQRTETPFWKRFLRAIGSSTPTTAPTPVTYEMPKFTTSFRPAAIGGRRTVGLR